MVSKTIKISEENYRWLLKMAADLQSQSERPISFNYTLNAIKNKSYNKMKKKKLSDLAGSWKMSDAEAEELKNNLRKSWKWKIQSV
ncbi:hypothetical protein J4466_01755 [Candidatus Pacearchaeota archaeon]|nr:hypothetical protein [Candidatus Pacearchaeota archaeon]